MCIRFTGLYLTVAVFGFGIGIFGGIGIGRIDGVGSLLLLLFWM